MTCQQAMDLVAQIEDEMSEWHVAQRRVARETLWLAVSVRISSVALTCLPCIGISWMRCGFWFSPWFTFLGAEEKKWQR